MTNPYQTQQWWELLAIQAGGTMCLPVLFVGQLLCMQYGWKAALFAIFAGNALLLAMGLAMATLSTHSPLNTFAHVKQVFGPLFQKILGVGLLICLLGWFAVQINLMTTTVLPSTASSSQLLTLGIGGSITLLMYLGYAAMRRIALISAPLLAIGLLCLFINTPHVPHEPLDFSWKGLSGISLVIGAHIAVIMDLPTFFQHARSQKDGWICITCLYALVVPFVEIGGVWLATTLEGGSISTLHTSVFWSFLISSLFLLAGFCANNANLYSAVEAASAMGCAHIRKGITLLLGALGTLLACMNPLGHIETLLESLGIALGTMGAIIITQFLCQSPQRLGKQGTCSAQTLSLISYGSGVGLGVLGYGFLTASIVLDACLMGAAAQGIGTYILSSTHNRRNRDVFFPN